MKIVNPISMAKLNLAILFTFPDAYQGYNFENILASVREEVSTISRENNEEWYKILTTALNVYQSAELIRQEKSFYFAGLENAFQKKCTDIKSDMLGLFISSEHYIDTTRILMSFDFSWLAQYGIPSSLEAETYFIQRLVDDMVKRGAIESHPNSKSLYRPAMGHRAISIKEKGTTMDTMPYKADVTTDDSTNDLQKALEIIAIQFLQKEIDELNGQVPVVANGTSFDSPQVAKLKRVRGLIKDHGLAFRLSKPKQDHFDVPEEICQVQLTKLLYPTDADLLETIVDLFVNEGH